MSPESYVGGVVGTGQCVAYVQECARAPQTALWKKGAAVRGNAAIASGTAIATFNGEGKYANRAHGNHAAIYLSQDAAGIWVYDQWTGQPVHKRQLRFKGGAGSASNDGDAFSVIE
jgi:hypothetical protein